MADDGVDRTSDTPTDGGFDPPDRYDRYDRYGPIDDRDGYAVSMAAGELSTITKGTVMLKAIAAVSAGLWALALISNFWNWFELSRDYGMSISFNGGPQGTNSVLQAMATTLTSTWGYLLVTVLAYGAAMALHAQRMRLLVVAAHTDADTDATAE